ncbi:MAG: hypothetical protein LBF55_03865, partial [Prevotellaceae bacterium]|nr:hypothetical protein [Prevotellaceae bacterium]
LFLFNKKYIRQNTAKRRGECLRCGACCRLFFDSCTSLRFDADGKSSCLKYKSFRMPNCKIFPVDCRDIGDRNYFSDSPCGYWFIK